MKFSTILPLASTASAAYLNLLAVRSASPLHYQQVNANENGIWIGKEASDYCPPGVNITCPEDQSTVFSGPITKNGTLSLGVIVPGGQQVYIDPSDGAVGYTIPHSAQMPNGSIQTGWNFQNTSAGFATLAWTGGLLFCSTSGNDSSISPWQMYADLPQLKFGSECLGVSLIADTGRGETKPIVWEY